MNNNTKLMFILMAVGIVIFSLVIIFMPLGKNSASLLGGQQVMYSMNTPSTMTVSQGKPYNLSPFLVTNLQMIKGFLIQGTIKSNDAAILKLVTEKNIEIGRLPLTGQGEFTGVINLPTEAIITLQQNPLIHFVIESTSEQSITLTNISLSAL